MKTIVTKDSLRQLIAEKGGNLVVGRALIRLANRQEKDERVTQETLYRNGVGFAACDAKTGTIGARYYSKTGKVPNNILKGWLKIGSDGYPRICKYAGQLNEIAVSEKYFKEGDRALVIKSRLHEGKTGTITKAYEPNEDTGVQAVDIHYDYPFKHQGTLGELNIYLKKI